MMIRGSLLFVGAVLAVPGTLPLRADENWRDVYSCGPSKGHSYFLNGEGWQVDGISTGKITLKRRGNDFDILIGDATGQAFSANGDGARVSGRAANGVIQVLAVYPSLTIETYLFSAPDRGRVTLAWTSSKQVSGIADRASIFMSTCTAK